MPIPSFVSARAACRVDLAGGTLDIWPLYLFHGNPLTVNFAVDVMTRCQIESNGGREIVLRSQDTGLTDRFASITTLRSATQLQHKLAGFLVRQFMGAGEWEGFTLTTNSESPAGAGISGSSALMVAATAALARFTGQQLDLEQMRVIAQNVEAQLIRVPTGCQDYYPALYGGVSAIHLRPQGIEREALAVAPEEIERRFVIAYTGAPRQSGINNWEVFQGHIGGDQRIHRNFDEIAVIAQGMRAALLAQDWQSVTRLLGEEWRLRRTNAPGITTPLIDRLIERTRGCGALAAKVCGAGGGGCVTIQIEPEARARVVAVIEAEGATVLPFRVARTGVMVEVARPAELKTAAALA